MNDAVEKTDWMSTAEIARLAPLATDVSADVCVIGARIAGLTTASLLACDGAQVVLLDDGRIAGDRPSCLGREFGTGPVFAQPCGIVAVGGGAIFVADSTLDAVVRVDPVTGYPPDCH